MHVLKGVLLIVSLVQDQEHALNVHQDILSLIRTIMFFVSLVLLLAEHVLKENQLVVCHVVVGSICQQILVSNVQLIAKPALLMDVHLVSKDIS